MWLRSPEGRRQVVFSEYLNHCRPLVLIISTPCTALMGFSALNRTINPEGWRRSWRISLALGNIATEAARQQLEEGRHIFIEQPANSELFETSNWQKLERDHRIYRVVFDQCMAGKIGKRTLMPIKKSTELRTSRRQFLDGLRKFKCDGNHEHASLGNAGSSSRPNAKYEKTSENVEWAPGVCRVLCAAISDYIHQRRYSRSYVVGGTSQPAAVATSKTARVVEPNCEACKRTLFKEHPAHTRRTGECRFPDVASMALKCPVCLAGNRPNDHPKHTKIEGECRNAPLGANGPRGRRSGLRIREYTPETPAPVAHHDPTGIIPPTAPASDAPEAEPAPAERVVEGTPSTGSASASGATAAAGGARLPASDARPSRPSSTNRAAQAPRATGNQVRETGTHTEEQEWTAFDVGHAVKLLHSATPDIVRRTLRRLHVRFYHAPAQRMKDLLAHAGAPKSALEMIKSVVETCRVCRLWTRPSARGMTITRLANGLGKLCSRAFCSSRTL